MKVVGGVLVVPVNPWLYTPVSSYGSGLEWFNGSLFGGQDPPDLLVYNVDGTVASRTPVTPTTNGAWWAMTVYKGQLLVSVQNQGIYAVDFTTPTAPELKPFVPSISFDAVTAFPTDVAAASAPTFDPTVLDGVDVNRYLPASARPLPPRLPVPEKVTLVASELLAGIGQPDQRGRLTAPLATVTGGRGVRVVSSNGELTLTAAQLAGYRLSANQRGQVKLVNASGRTVARRISALQLR